MRIAFLGTPEFAIPSLNACIEYGEVVSVITQPDKQRGRGKKVQMTHIKEEAVKHDLEVYQPVKIKGDEHVEYLKSLNLDLMVVVAYGQILSKEILDIPKYGCINVHASILPKLRGAAPLNWAIVRGDKVSGVTIMQMDVGLDTGDMLSKIEVIIPNDMTAGELHDSLMVKGAVALIETLKDIEEGNLTPIKQDDELSTYAPMMDKEMAEIDFNNSANDIHNLVRGFNPWPVTYTKYQGKKVKIYKTEVIDENSNGKNGEILEVSEEGIKIKTTNKCLMIKEIQFPNKKRVDVKSYLNGNSIEIGIVLGE